MLTVAVSRSYRIRKGIFLNSDVGFDPYFRDTDLERTSITHLTKLRKLSIYAIGDLSWNTPERFKQD